MPAEPSTFSTPMVTIFESLAGFVVSVKWTSMAPSASKIFTCIVLEPSLEKYGASSTCRTKMRSGSLPSVSTDQSPPLAGVRSVQKKATMLFQLSSEGMARPEQQPLLDWSEKDRNPLELMSTVS